MVGATYKALFFYIDLLIILGCAQKKKTPKSVVYFQLICLFLPQYVKICILEVVTFRGQI